jgi:AcrR family transcriptional regulator
MVAAATKLEPKSRLTATHWEQAALDAIAESGLSAVAVESLARRLGVTKGSFYWHFATREALIKAALERWERGDEGVVMTQVEDIADPRERLRELFHRVSREMPSHMIYAALMQSLDHPIVKPVMTRVSQRRLDVLAQAYREAGLDAATATHRARLAYSAYTGFLQLSRQMGLPRLHHDEFEAYVDHVIATLVPA